VIPTIYDVAARAGVAPVTVSRVLNNSGYASEATRRKVEAAVAELGYTPNRLAQGLRSKQTRTLALIVTDITNPFWTTVARGVEDAAHRDGFSVVLCNTDESQSKQNQYVDLLLQKQVDGFLLVPAGNDAETVLLIQERGVPVVVLDRRIAVPADSVRCDSEGGAYHLTQHLIERGHRRIAVLSGSRDVSTATDRVTGYRRALGDAGIPVDERLICHRSFTQEAGYEMTLEVLKIPPQPTALFAVNNFIAIGAVRALREAGLRVPEDMALVAFDDLPLTLIIEPFLTVASQPAYAMGQRATELLLSRLAGEGAEVPAEIVLPTDLVVRMSSG
jgi:LacI family transcriptional regulator